MNTNQKTTAQISSPPATTGYLIDNQNGSVIVLVLMVLVIMTLIGIASTDSLVTENFIIRNVGIHKQNASLVDSALMLGLQQFMQLDNSNPDNFDPALNVWINDETITTAGAPEELINTIWYNPGFTQRGKPQRQPALCRCGMGACTEHARYQQQQSARLASGPDTGGVCLRGCGRQ